MKQNPNNFYRMPAWAVHLAGFFSLLTILLILIKLASISSTFQSTLTIDELIWGAAAMSMATSWMRTVIPAAAVSTEHGGDAAKQPA